MPWQQVSPGRYEREFSLMERFYRGIAARGEHIQKEQYLISSAVQLKTAPPVTELQKAWTALRHRHPQIAIVADEGISRCVYTVPSPDDLDAWVRETLIVHTETDCSADTLHSSLLPSPLLMLHYIPSTRQLLFRTPHWRIDGIGLLHLQDAFFSILARGAEQPHFDGSELNRTVPPLEEVANLPKEITPEMDQTSNTELAVLAVGAPPVSIPTQPSTMPTNTIRVGISLPQDLSQQLISACKTRDISVTTAVQAALIILTKAHAQPQDGRFVCFNIIDLRKYLPEPWNGAPGALGVYHTGLTCSVDLATSKDFNAITTNLKANYRRDIPSRFSYMTDYVQKVGSILAVPIELAIQAPAHPELSSLGVIDDYLQSKYTGPASTFEIEDWWIGVQVVNRILQTYLWTRHGQMNLQVAFNEAFYEKGYVEKFLEDWRDLLAKELLD